MNEAAQVSRLIERLYDAALDADLWTTALEQICRYVQGCTANLFCQDAASSKFFQFHSWGQYEYYFRTYIDTYASLNPLFPAASFLEVGTVHAVSEVMPIEKFQASRLYREWARPQGVLDALYCNLERTATGGGALAIRRLERDGLFDVSAKERFALIVPHARCAISIGRVIEFHRVNEAALSATLDRLTAAVFLVSGDGRLVYLNVGAEVMLVAGDLLRALNGRLSTVVSHANAELQQAMAATARGVRASA